MNRGEALSYVIKAYNARSHIFTLIGKLEDANRDLNSIMKSSKNSIDEISALKDKAHIAFLKGNKNQCESFAVKEIAMAEKKNVHRGEVRDRSLPSAADYRLSVL